MAAAIDVGMSVIKMQCKGLRMFADKCLEVRGVTPKMHLVRQPDPTLYQQMYDMFGDAMDQAIRTGSVKKNEVYTAFDVVEKQVGVHVVGVILSSERA